jgi:hypothetical protein
MHEFFLLKKLAFELDLISPEDAETPCYTVSDAILIECETCPDERIWYDAHGQGYCLHCAPLEAFDHVE